MDKSEANENLMFQKRSLLASSWLIIVIFVALCQPVMATTLQFNISAGNEKIETLQLTKEDHVAIKIDATGLIDFTLTDPRGNAKIFEGTAHVDYSFVCNDEGKYTLRFSNVGSIEDRLVTVDYEVQHYIFGIPQMLFLTLVIVLFCMAAVAVFVMMSRPS